jgi:hypothetical protein
LDPSNPQQLIIRRGRREEWPVLIQDHHAAYLSYEKYLKNQERLGNNSMMSQGKGKSSLGPAREGEALLQGLVRCGHCGRSMYVNYGGHRSEKGRTMQYRCGQARQQIGAKSCHVVGGRRIDQSVVKSFLEVVAPAGVEAACAAEELSRDQHNEVSRQWDLQIEKAEYAAQRAERQYDAVEPENRVVARELERRWNERLGDLVALQEKARKALDEPRCFTPKELEQAHALGADLEAMWDAETTKNRDRKRLLRCVIEEVQLRTETGHYGVRIVWKGGAATDHEVIRRAVGTGHATAEETVDLVRRLAEEFDDVQIARILNKQGRRSGLGNSFTQQRVTSLRGHHKIAACPKSRPKDPTEGPFTADEAAVELGVGGSTIYRWLGEGVLAGTQLTPGAPWKITLTEDIRKKLTAGEAPPNWVGLTEASRRVGISKQRIVYLVKTGKLNAVRTKVGKRQCWRIDVDSATCGKQNDLFDQTINEQTKGA